MAYVDWRLEGQLVSTCNCDWGCPCQFNASPTAGHCRAAVAINVDRGHFGEVDLAGVRIVTLLAWPQAIHLGNGEVLPVVDSAASEAQRDAILRIVSGEETEPGATVFNVFASTIAKVHEPLILPIAFEADQDAATARFSIPDLLDAEVQPIRNPMTGQPHRARLSLPTGFEYHVADFASSKVGSGSKSPIALQWADQHAHMCRLDMGPYGLFDRAAA